MDIKSLKRYVFENEKISDVLEAVGCHHINDRMTYIQCCNPDGDNPTAICVYKNEWLGCINYTRDMSKYCLYDNKYDIISLIQFLEDCDFVQAVKICCDAVGIEYYHNFEDDVPESIIFLRLLNDLDTNTERDNCKLTPKSESVLSYYKKYYNYKFYNDGISFDTQAEFEVGFDEATNRITIPIRGEDGTLLGVKGRSINDTDTPKYTYIESCPKGKILYGLYKTLPYIKRQNCVYVFESEKAVMQAWSYGDYNCVATGGKTISQQQVDMICRVCSNVIFAFDKDVDENEIKNIYKMFPSQINTKAILDKSNILSGKESPTDDFLKWKKLKECVIDSE